MFWIVGAATGELGKPRDNLQFAGSLDRAVAAENSLDKRCARSRQSDDEDRRVVVPARGFAPLVEVCGKEFDYTINRRTDRIGIIRADEPDEFSCPRRNT